MIQIKYLIIIGIIICLLVLYYFYDEISNIKKIFLPTYHKTMALEAKLLELEKKTNDIIPKKKSIIQKNDSPAMTISYQSDMVKNGNLSVRYADLSETEAKELLKHIDQNKTKPNTPIVCDNPTRDNPPQQNPKKNNTADVDAIFDSFACTTETKQVNSTKDDIYGEETDTINIKISDLVKINNNTNQTEYQKILNGLTKSMSNIHSEDVFYNDTELDQDIIKSISESIQYADLPSDTILSDIPVVTKSKNSNININKNTGKKSIMKTPAKTK